MKEMDYIIYRQATNDFMRWSDGEIYVSNDLEDIIEEFEKEVAENTNPIILTLEYNLYFDSTGQEHQNVFVKIKDGIKVGDFSYMSHFDDNDDFLDALDDWAKYFVEEQSLAR